MSQIDTFRFWGNLDLLILATLLVRKHCFSGVEGVDLFDDFSKDGSRMAFRGGFLEMYVNLGAKCGPVWTTLKIV